MKWLTSPLEAFTRHVELLPETFGRHHLLETDSRDEIGIMAQAFNRMVTTLEAQQAANESRLGALVRLNEMSASSLKEIADFALEEAVRLTRSTIGYVAFVNDDESLLTMYSWSREAMGECAIADKPLEYPLATTGLWGEAVRQRRPVITNDYATPSPFKKGYPPGHVDVRRHMNAPIFDGERIVIVAGVGNKDEAYDEIDVNQLTLLMQAMWRLIQRKKSEEALQKEKEKFSLAFEAVPSVLVITSLVLTMPFMYQTMFAPVAVFLHRMSGFPSPVKSPVPAIVQSTPHPSHRCFATSFKCRSSRRRSRPRAARSVGNSPAKRS